jgi:hypothetical protein
MSLPDYGIGLALHAIAAIDAHAAAKTARYREIVVAMWHARHDAEAPRIDGRGT